MREQRDPVFLDLRLRRSPWIELRGDKDNVGVRPQAFKGQGGVIDVTDKKGGSGVLVLASELVNFVRIQQPGVDRGGVTLRASYLEGGDGVVYTQDRNGAVTDWMPSKADAKQPKIPLRTDLADDLRKWLATLQNERHEASDTDGQRIALTFQRNAGDALPLDTPLFTVPTGLVRILDRDLIAAGIPKRDERGRTIDGHALRHSFRTLLSKGGVAPRTAQQAMRHSDIQLTKKTYTDPKLLDVQGALDSLPSLPLTDSPIAKHQAAKATATGDARSLLGQPLVQGLGKIGTSEGISGHPLTTADSDR